MKRHERNEQGDAHDTFSEWGCFLQRMTSRKDEENKHKADKNVNHRAEFWYA